jgi:ElaB/YqjD/DUF883 family membrane-anchored ribosome-binding protein
MIYEPTRSDESLSASSPSDASPSTYGERAVEAQRDRNHSIDHALENKLADLRDSFDDRADELRRRTTRFRAAIDVKERIRDRPLVAMAIGAAAGGALAMVRPMGRTSSGILGFLVARAVRQVALQIATRVYQELMNPQQLRDDAIEHSHGYGASGGFGDTNGLQVHPL